MATVKVLGGDLFEGSWQLYFNVLTIPSTPAHLWKGEKVDLGSELASVEQLTDERVKKLAGTAGWGFLGAVTLGPLGAIAGILLGGNRTQVTFLAELKDGRKFIGQTDAKSYGRMVGFTLTRKS